MIRFFYFLIGYYRLRFHTVCPEKILEFCLKEEIPVFDIFKEDDGVSFSAGYASFRRLEKRLAEKNGLFTGRETHFSGVAGFLWRARRRPGFLVGGLLFFAALLLSGRLIWNVEFTGNTATSDRELRAILRERGMEAGKFISSIDFKKEALDLAALHPEFTYVNLNMVGTRLRVEVREREAVERPEKNTDGTNLVAARSGRIVRFEVLAGQAAVKREECVEKGKLLISGITENKNGTCSVVHARGRVIAETEREFSVTVPFTETGTVYTGRECERSSYSFLGFCITFPNFEKNPYADAEIFETEENLRLFGWELPILRKKRVYLEKEKTTKPISVDRAVDLAYDKYDTYKREEFENEPEILEETLLISQGEENITLESRLTVRENIAAEQPFSYSPALEFIGGK